MAALERLDLLADPAGLGLAVPMPDQAHRFARFGIRPQRLAQPPLVRRDQAGRRRQDLRGGPVILLQPDHIGARKILLEAQDVAHLGPAPAIDRLVVVAHAADVAMRLRQQPQPHVLRDVGVLILVHQDIAEPVLPLAQHVWMRLEQRHAMHQQVAEIDRVQRQQPVLIGRVQLAAMPIKRLTLAPGQVAGRDAAVLPPVDQMRQLPCGPTLLVDVLGRDQLLQQADLVVRVQNGKAGLQVQVAVPDQLGMAAQDLDADAVEGAQPRHPLDRIAQQAADPVLHLARGLVGEGHGQQLPGPCLAQHQQMRDPRGQRARLARACPRQHQDRPVQRFDSGALRGVQPVQIRRGPRGHRALRQRHRRQIIGIVEMLHSANIGIAARQGKPDVRPMFSSVPKWCAPSAGGPGGAQLPRPPRDADQARNPAKVAGSSDAWAKVGPLVSRLTAS